MTLRLVLLPFKSQCKDHATGSPSYFLRGCVHAARLIQGRSRELVDWRLAAHLAWESAQAETNGKYEVGEKEGQREKEERKKKGERKGLRQKAKENEGKGEQAGEESWEAKGE